MDDATRQKIQQTIDSDQVVLFMKGRRRMPQCGFSAQVVSILDQMVEDYTTVNVLADPDIRDGIKAFSNWPTIPQLYVKGKFVGGCDIVTEMFEHGELEALLGVELPDVPPPAIHLSPSAARELSAALASEGATSIRLGIDARFRPTLGIDNPGSTDLVVEVSGVRLVVDRGSASRSNGLRIDFVEGADGGFKIDNPNEPPKVRQVTPRELSDRLAAGEELVKVDVRTAEEQGKAAIDGFRLLDDQLRAELLDLPKDTPIVFHCHHGGRSQAAAEYFLGQGFTRVHNLAGGIDAWSREVDPSIPRY